MLCACPCAFSNRYLQYLLHHTVHASRKRSDEKSLVIWRGDPHTFTLAAASYQIPGPIHELPEISPTQTHTAKHGDRSHYPFAGGGTLADRKTAGPCTGHSPHPLPSVQAGVGAVVQ